MLVVPCRLVALLAALSPGMAASAGNPVGQTDVDDRRCAVAPVVAERLSAPLLTARNQSCKSVLSLNAVAREYALSLGYELCASDELNTPCAAVTCSPELSITRQSAEPGERGEVWTEYRFIAMQQDGQERGVRYSEVESAARMSGVNRVSLRCRYRVVEVDVLPLAEPEWEYRDQEVPAPPKRKGQSASTRVPESSRYCGKGESPSQPPGDEFYSIGEQWGLGRIHIQALWKFAKASNGGCQAPVAVIDDGFFTEHVELSGAVRTECDLGGKLPWAR